MKETIDILFKQEYDKAIRKTCSNKRKGEELWESIERMWNSF